MKFYFRKKYLSTRDGIQNCEECIQHNLKSVDCFNNVGAVIFKSKFGRLAPSSSNNNPVLRAFNKFKDTNQKKLTAAPAAKKAVRKGGANEMNKDKKFLQMIHKEFSEHPPSIMEDLGSPSRDRKQIEKIDLCISEHSQEVLQFLERREVFWKQMGT